MNFDYLAPQTIDDAISANPESARWFAGGTDLIPLIKLGLAAPARLVNLKQVDGLRGIQETPGGVRIGALVTLAELAHNTVISSRYRALAQACQLAGSPQIRNMATLGGNLCQDSRCAYYRSGFDCFLSGGNTCYMRGGENREAAIIGSQDCAHVHPSDPANALVAFDARILTRGRGGERSIPARDFFRAPDAGDRRMNVLQPEEIVVAIVLPPASENTRSAYVKAMDRAVWTFALASAAVRLELQNSRIESASVVLGGVAPTPWQEFRIAEKLSGIEWEQTVVTQVDVDILEGTLPLEHNTYKIRLARAMVKRALRECWTTTES